MQFEWDEAKAAANFKKHGAGFDEAATVWDDYFQVDFFDDAHSVEENRFIIVGESVQNRLLIVSYAERRDKIRIISARELTAKERREYEHGKFE